MHDEHPLRQQTGLAGSLASLTHMQAEIVTKGTA